MHTASILQRDGDETQLWRLTWDRIDAFLPSLRDEVFKPHESGLCFLQLYNSFRAMICRHNFNFWNFVEWILIDC